MFAKTAIVALAAGAQISFAAPVRQEERSLKAIGTALAGGAASLLTGAILNNKREESGIMVDTETGVIYMDVPDAVEERSLKAVGIAVAGGIASGAAGAIASNLLGKRSLTAIENFLGGLFNKRSEPSGLMVDTETGVIYMEVADANEGRSLKAIGTAVAGGIASGVAGAVVSDIFGKRAEPSGLMVDTETGVIYMDIADAPEGRSLKAIGTAVAGGIASGAAGAIVSNLFDKREPASGLMVDTETGVIYADIPDANEERSLKAIGTAVAGGIASGAAGAIVSDLFNKREELSGLMVDTETGTIFMDVPDVVEDRSLQAIGNFFHSIFGKRDEPLDARSLQAIGNIFHSIFGKRGEELDERSFDAIGNAIQNFLDDNFHIAKRGEELDARSLTAIGNFFRGIFGKRGEELDARSLSAIENFLGGLFNKRDEPLDERSLTAIGNAIGSFAEAVLGPHFGKRDEQLDARSLQAIGSIFHSIFGKRGEELDARSLTAIGNFFRGIFGKRSELEDSMAKRSINDLE